MAQPDPQRYRDAARSGSGQSSTPRGGRGLSAGHSSAVMAAVPLVPGTAGGIHGPEGPARPSPDPHHPRSGRDVSLRRDGPEGTRIVPVGSTWPPVAPAAGGEDTARAPLCLPPAAGPSAAAKPGAPGRGAAGAALPSPAAPGSADRRCHRPFRPFPHRSSGPATVTRPPGREEARKAKGRRGTIATRSRRPRGRIAGPTWP